MDNNVSNIIAGVVAFIHKNLPVEKHAEFLSGLTKKLEQEKSKVTVYSAIELTIEEKEALGKYLKTKTENSEIEYQVDKNLVGGLKIKIGDNLLDRSLAGKIEQISEI